MPASSSEGRGRWRKRKREHPSARKSRLKEPENDDTFEDNNEDDDDPDLDPPQNHLETDDDPQNHGPDAGNHISGEKESEKLADSVVRICEFPAAVKRAVIKPHSSVLGIVEAERSAQAGDSKSQNQAIPVLENISYGQLQTLSAIPRDSTLNLSSEETSSGSGSGSYVIKPPRITPGRGVIKRLGSAGRVHVVPAHSDWFSLNTVHRLERQVVPHFFCGKSPERTPEKYMECRNFIVAKYVENPEKHLTASECQDLVSGIEIDDLNRIVRFLDHWGIINYCASPLTREAPSDRTYLFEDSNSELHVPSASLKSIDSLIKFNKPKCRLKAADVYPEIAHQHHDEDSDYDSTIREQLSENYCNHCGRSLGTVYYQSNKEVDVLLCLECFLEGRFAAGHSSLDFVKFNSVSDYPDVDGEDWSDQDTLLLLEGVQLYDDNWNKIVEHVGTKSKPQCILHFLRLPLDSAPIENINMPSPSGSSDIRHDDEHEKSNPHSNGFTLQKSDSESSFPFKDLKNPVMSLVAFLASALGPRVAAACAHTSLASLCKNGDSDGNPHEETSSNNNNTKGPCSSQHELETLPLSAEKEMDAAKDGLATSAVKGKLFADHEEREIQRLSANIINHQLKRLELKLKQIAEMETSLMRECEQMERTRQRISAERALIVSSQYGSPPMSRPTNLQSLISNNRPQVPGPQPPFMTNYGHNNSQPIHPHISLMQQPGMYGLSPRLPLSAMQPSSSSFNPQSNSQSSLGHPMLRPISGAKSGLG